ncbi:MAG: ammonia-forming cytochrome c nitrite reductase [Azoarcus sp.]|jgi:nitrite reductase (cytochrome c-552)|nr:ammonia-forming cytochrome c nitrite reductase [Azoarcus sp.]
MSNFAETIKQKPSVGWLLLLIALVVVFLLGLLAASITEKRAEVATLYSNKKVNIEGIESRSPLWGLNFPREYDTWKKTQETDFRSKHLGNAVEDVLESRPYIPVLWAGYAFSRDYNAPRGHWYTLEDMRATLRVGAPGVGENKDMQPGTCWTCKSPDVPRMMKEIGIENYYSSKWSELGADIVNPLGCADCHDPKTMNLTITRPALIEAFQRQGKDVTKASPQEMRSLVCAQCHVEYYFKGDGKYLTFPWDKGYTMEDMEKYYDEIGFKDWVHALSKAPMLKVQHPDYELFLLGTHGQRGLSCADCHMPYKSEGGIKYSNHQVMSPLKNVAAACQTCHRDSEANLLNYVYERQDKVLEVRDRVEAELAKAHIMAKKALDAGVTEDQIKPVQQLLRQAGWRWDFAVASHGGSFHAPVETQRILAHALDKSFKAQIEAQKLLTAKGVAFTDADMPDLSTKEKAQKFIGLNMEKFKADKKEFLTTVVPGWLEKAKAEGKLIDDAQAASIAAGK